MVKLKAVVILLIIIASVIPVYSLNKYLQKIIRPRDSAGRLVLYMITGLALIFVFTFLIVLLIRQLFHPASP